MTTAAILHPSFTTPTITDAAVYIAPARFDVHAVDAIARWADEALADANQIIVDLRIVAFMDLQMINELDRLRDLAAADGVTVELVNLSAAAALTFDLLERAAA